MATEHLRVLGCELGKDLAAAADAAFFELANRGVDPKGVAPVLERDERGRLNQTPMTDGGQDVDEGDDWVFECQDCGDRWRNPAAPIVECTCGGDVEAVEIPDSVEDGS